MQACANSILNGSYDKFVCKHELAQSCSRCNQPGLYVAGRQFQPAEAASVEDDLQALNALLSGEDASPGGGKLPAPNGRPSLGGRPSFGDRPPPARAGRRSGGFDAKDSAPVWQRTSGTGNSK